MYINAKQKSMMERVNLLSHIKEPISLEEALNLVLALNFDVFIQSGQIIEIRFEINEELDEQGIEILLEPQLIAKISAIISFMSMVDYESRIFWKTKNQRNFKLLEVCDYSDGYLTKLCYEFLVKKLQNGETGILKIFENENTLNPKRIGNKDGHNLLSIAVTQNNDVMVEKLLKYKFDDEFNDRTDVQISISDLAWEIYTNANENDAKISSNKIILNLLICDAKFPKNFDYHVATKEVQKLVNDRDELHKFINSKNYDGLKNILSENNDFNFYYDETNKSLLMRALEMNIDSDTLVLLNSLNLKTGNHEIVEANKFYEKIRNANRKNAKDLPKAHILMLKAKSKVADYNHPNLKYSELISETYQKLDENECCSNVLKIVAAYKKIKIFFDFKHDTAYYFDPTRSIKTSAVAYETGEIHIGAKNLFNECEKHELFGVMIHEFCHIAILMTYMNDFDPFQMGESENKTKFIETVVKECFKNRAIENMIENVFESYPAAHVNSELIVLVCQMLMHYYTENSNLKNRQQNFPELFKYFKNIVEPELIKALPIFKKLQDDEQKINFSELTEPMKAKILNIKINFQGENVALLDIIGNDEDTLNLLDSNDIKNLLLNRKEFKIDNVLEECFKYEYIDRNFINFKKDDYFKEFKSFKQVTDEVIESKTFILAAKAGEGKTATFQNYTKKLKEKNKKFWVSFIKLRHFRDIFSEINFEKTIDINFIFKIFVNILFLNSRINNFDMNSDFKIKIFEILFYTGKVILLLDGIDEICPKFNQHVIKILSILRKNTNNQLWISTRPQHVDQLMEILGVKAFTLKPYGNYEQKKLIIKICEKLNKKVDDFYSQLQWFFKSYKDFNNPLLIILVTEMYINETIDLNNELYDNFKIYELLVDEQFENIKSKVDSKDQNRSLKFPLLHQVLALKFVFEEEQIKDLKILKDWKKDKKNWTPEKIQRFGFVIVDLNFLENDDKGSIDFIHYSIAEFFVAQYLAENIFDHYKNDEEIIKLFGLIKTLKLKNTEFLLDYLTNHWDLSEEYIHNKLIELIVDEIEKCSKINVKYGDLDSLYFWCAFLRNKPEILKKIWQINEKKTLFNKILFRSEILNMMSQQNNLKFVCDCLGKNWHEILNNSDEKLNFKEENEIEVKSQFQKESNYFFKNFYKLLILVEKTFNSKEKKLFETSIDLFFIKPYNALHGNYYVKCFEKILQNFKDNEAIFINILLSIIRGVVDCKKLIYFQEILESYYENNREKIRKMLFNTSVTKKIMSRLKNSQSVKDDKKDFPIKFKIFYDVYDKYKNSWEEVQIVFLNGEFIYHQSSESNLNDFVPFILKPTSGSIFDFLEKIDTDYIPEFMVYLKKIFQSNNDYFLKYVYKSGGGFTTELLLVLENILIKYFNGDENMVRKGMRKILYSDNKENLYFPADKLAKYIDLRRKYQNSVEEFQNDLKSWTVLSKIFYFMTYDSYPAFINLVEEIFCSNKPDLYECITDVFWNSSIIESEEKFGLLEIFFNEFYCYNVDEVRKCVQKLIFSCMNFSMMFTRKLEDQNEFQTFKNRILKYIEKEKIREDFVSKNILLCSFAHYSHECHFQFIEFVREIFEDKNEPLFLSEICNLPSMHTISTIHFIQSETQFEYFEKFLMDFYENDQNRVKNTVRTLLFNENVIKEQIYLRSFNHSNFQYVRKLYTKYKNCWQEIQNIFIASQDLLEIFSVIKVTIFSEFQDFLIEVFESNKSLLFKCFNYEKCDSLIKKQENLKFLENFLQTFTNNDEKQIKECMHEILFGKSDDKFNPLFVFVEIQNLEKLEYLITTYKKYKNSWEELQNFFTSKPLSNLFFRLMSDKTYPIFEKFIGESFASNKSRLNEIELKYENVKFEDYFYDEDNEKHFIEKFKEYCISETKC